MDEIIRGTTPTIKFTYSEISVSDISIAILTLSQSGTIVIEKNLSEATVGSDYISWKLSQAETLSLSKKDVTVICDWVLANGTRGRSNVLVANIGEPGKNEVL